MAILHLNKGREKSLERHHPWIFDGAVAHVEGTPNAGDTVEVHSAKGEWLARASYSPRSQIRARVWTFDKNERIDADFFRRRLAASVQARHLLRTRSDLTAVRLVYSESDGLPGLIVDQYGDFLVAQFLSAGAERWKKEIAAALVEEVPCRGLFERSDAMSRNKEGLALHAGVLHGEEPPATIEIQEGPVRFLVDVRRGHKTGFYLDQRDNRAALAAVAAGKDVLNCFAYTGGFGVAALQAGATKVTNVEASSEALALSDQNFALNGLSAEKVENVTGDVFRVLRQWREENRAFDVIVLDPPKFAENKQQVEGACRGYKDVNMLAFQLLRPGGLLFTFSCSGLIDPALFQKLVADAALDAGRTAQIVQRLDQAGDHPVALPFPEAQYLKGLVCRVG